MTNSTITIPLSKRGKRKNQYVTIVDIVDSDLLSINWSVKTDSRTQYATRVIRFSKTSSRREYMHRIILARKLERELLPDEYVDHIDGNGLNNLRSNLRLATNSQNQANARKNVKNTSGYKGVFKHKNRWRARIRVNGKNINVGSFDTAELANEALCKERENHCGEFTNHGND